jgi:hypothetical protein
VPAGQGLVESRKAWKIRSRDRQDPLQGSCFNSSVNLSAPL